MEKRQVNRNLDAIARLDARLRPCTRALHLTLAMFTVHQVLVAVSAFRANQFYTYDIGHIDYMLYYTLHGHFFWSIVHECPHFAKHFTPTLILLVPFRGIFQHVLFMPILETLAMMSGAWAVAWMTDGILRRGRKLGRGFSPLALAAGLFYAANPWVGSIFLSYHFESLAAALSLWALAALVNRRMRLFWLFVILALGCKEDMPIYWGFFGVWWFAFRGQRMIGSSTLAAGEKGRLHGRDIRFPLALVLISGAWLIIAMLTIRWTAQASGQSVLEYRLP